MNFLGQESTKPKCAFEKRKTKNRPKPNERYVQRASDWHEKLQKMQIINTLVLFLVYSPPPLLTQSSALQILTISQSTLCKVARHVSEVARCGHESQVSPIYYVLSIKIRPDGHLGGKNLENLDAPNSKPTGDMHGRMC